MAIRVLTTKFLSYPIAQWEKATGKGVLDLLDVGNLELNKIAQVVKLGIPKISKETEEEHFVRAYERIDNYMMQDEKGLIDLFLQMMREYDMDFKILKASGQSIDDLEADLKAEMQKNVKKASKNAIGDDKDEEEQVEEKEVENVLHLI